MVRCDSSSAIHVSSSRSAAFLPLRLDHLGGLRVPLLLAALRVQDRLPVLVEGRLGRQVHPQLPAAAHGDAVLLHGVDEAGEAVGVHAGTLSRGAAGISACRRAPIDLASPPRGGKAVCPSPHPQARGSVIYRKGRSVSMTSADCPVAAMRIGASQWSMRRTSSGSASRMRNANTPSSAGGRRSGAASGSFSWFSDHFGTTGSAVRPSTSRRSTGRQIRTRSQRD